MQPRMDSTGARTAQILLPSKNEADGGWVEVNPDFIESFEALGLETPDQFLELEGEVVSGHPDRHVVRVNLPRFSRTFYLKKQHAVMWREKLRNWLAGFGWISRSEREGITLKQLTAAGLSCPRWAAFGVDGIGRAFLLVEEVADTLDLRQFLNDRALSQTERASFAKTLGQWIAFYHNSGFTTPDLTAKHVLISSATRKLTLIDWQSATRIPFVSPEDRLRPLAALNASLSVSLASTRERLRVLRTALRASRQEGLIAERFSEIVHIVIAETNRLRDRRSLRDQRQQLATVNQPLVWVAGEAVCAVPSVAAVWPDPAIAKPYYGCAPGTFPIQLPDGRDAVLIRGRSVAPLGRFQAWLRGRSWRSAGVTLGRLLFHLERYGIPAPRLLAFGQRFTGPITTEWFTLYTPPAAPIDSPPSGALAAQLGRVLRQVHDAGCSAGNQPLGTFGVEKGCVCVRDPMAISIANTDTERELRCFLSALSPWVRKAAEMSYRSGQEAATKAKSESGTPRIYRLVSAEVI